MVTPRVVVVDDEELNRKFVASALEGEFEVETAQDWVSAASLIFRTKPELVILDVNLPVVGGQTIADSLRNAKSPSKILLYSAIDESQLRTLAKKVGAAGYLTKPCDVDRLRAKVRQVLAPKT